MKIKKILNNNAVIVMDGAQEKIAIGAGVGFEKRKKDIVQANRIEKLFVLKENEKLQQLLQRIPEEHFIISEEIIRYAEEQLETNLNNHIRVLLTDHISFAIEREQQGIRLQNKLLQEIKILYRQEFEIGRWAVKHIEEKLSIPMSIDEAAFIALHIHTMKIKGGDLHETVRQTSIIQEMVEIIKNCLAISIKETDISYERLIIHLRFALTRTADYESHVMDDEMFEMIKGKYVQAYNCARKVSERVATSHGIEFTEQELGYITLHIERLRTN